MGGKGKNLGKEQLLKTDIGGSYDRGVLNDLEQYTYLFSSC